MIDYKHGTGATAQCVWTNTIVGRRGIGSGTGKYRCVNPFMHNGFDHVWELVSWHVHDDD